MVDRKAGQSSDKVKQWKVIQAQVQSLAKKAGQVKEQKSGARG
jgi:hypothetical protein